MAQFVMCCSRCALPFSEPDTHWSHGEVWLHDCPERATTGTLYGRLARLSPGENGARRKEWVDLVRRKSLLKGLGLTLSGVSSCPSPSFTIVVSDSKDSSAAEDIDTPGTRWRIRDDRADDKAKQTGQDFYRYGKVARSRGADEMGCEWALWRVFDGERGFYVDLAQGWDSYEIYRLSRA